MNAIETLKLDHRVVDALFQQAMNMQPSKRGPVYKKISNELAAHAHIEESIFYPRLLKEGNKDLKKIVLEGIEEHSQIHMFHDQLDTMKPAEEKFEPKLKVLKEDIRHHVKEEENEMFDLVEAQFSSEALERLGDEMEAERTRFQKAKGIPKRTAAENALGQGMLSRMIDAVTGLFMPNENGKKQKRAGSSNSKASRGSSKASSAKSSNRSPGTAKSGNASTAAKKTASGSRSAKSASNGKSSGRTSASGNGRSAKSSSTKSSGSATKKSSARSASSR